MSKLLRRGVFDYFQRLTNHTEEDFRVILIVPSTQTIKALLFESLKENNSNHRHNELVFCI
jgi:hypothetical protein